MVCDMSIGPAECPGCDSASGCWHADGSRACDHLCDCMCHWSFDRLRGAIARLSAVANWALEARSILSALAPVANDGDTEPLRQTLTETLEVVEVRKPEKQRSCDSVATNRLHSPGS